MIDILLLAVLAGVTWCVANDGPWGAAYAFVAVVVSGLVAMNYFEPLAAFMGANVLTSFDWQNRWDVIAFCGIFAAGVFGLREIAERAMPTYAQVHPILYQFGRWGIGAATGYVTMAILLTALHTAPVPREFLGFTPERKNFFLMTAPDRQWLGFTQFVSERCLKTRNFDGTTQVFDGAVFPANPSDSGTISNTMQTWSSFPIRYAARREFYAGGASAPQMIGGSPPPPPAVPGGSGTGGF